MSKVADPMREFVETYLMNNTTQENEQWLAMTGRSLLRIADEIDREHERRMYQQSHDLRKAFCRYIGGVVDDYKRGHKRKSWLRQMKMQLELEVLRFKATEDGGTK